MGNRGFLAIVAAIGFVGLLGFGLASKGVARPAVGDPVPDAPLPRLGGTEEVSFADYRGQWVLVNLWASWCPPCRDEAPALEKYSRRHEGDVAVLGIDTDDATPDALAFAREFGITYELLHDGEGARKDELGATGLPESFLIDPEGNLALWRIGPVDERFLEGSVTPLIESRGGAS